MPVDFEIFRAGEYPQGSFPIERVQQIVNDYDPAFLEASITLDHEQWGPAFGWVRGVRLEGDTMVGALDIHPMLARAYKDGEYKKRSVEILSPGRSPTGRHYLSAVTFLGAMNPQVPGLADPQFANPEERIFVDLPDNSEKQKQHSEKGGAHTMSKLKDALKRIFSKAVDELDETQFAAGESAAGETPPAQTAEPPKTQMASEAEKARFAGIEAENARLKAENAQLAQAKRQEEIHGFCEGLKREGKLLPAWQEAGIEKFMAGLEQVEGKAKFSAVAGAAEQSAGEFFRSFLSGLPKLVEFDEKAAGGQGAESEQPDEHEFMAVSRQYADEKKVSMAAAMRHVEAKQPELHAAFLEFCAATTKTK